MAACVATPNVSWRDLEVFLRDYKGCRDAETVRRGQQVAEALHEVPPQALDAVQTVVKELCEALGEVVSPEVVDLEEDRMEVDLCNFVEGTVQTLVEVLAKLRESVGKFETQGQLDMLVDSLGPIVVPPLFFTEKIAFSNQWRDAVGDEKYVQSCKEVVQKLAIAGSLKLVEAVLCKVQHRRGAGDPEGLLANVMVQVWNCLLRIGINSSSTEHMEGPLKSYFIINFAWSKLAWIQELGLCDCQHPDWSKHTEFTLPEVHNLLCTRVLSSFESLLQSNGGHGEERETITIQASNVPREDVQAFAAGLKVVRFWLQHLCKFVERNCKVLFSQEEKTWQMLIHLTMEITLKSLHLERDLAFLVCNNLLIFLHRSTREALGALSKSMESSQNLASEFLELTLGDNHESKVDMGSLYAGLVTVCGTFSSQDVPDAATKVLAMSCHIIMKALRECLPMLMNNVLGAVEPYDGSALPVLSDFLAWFARAILHFEDKLPDIGRQEVSPWNCFEKLSLEGLLSADVALHHCFATTWLNICHEVDEQLVYAHCSALLIVLEKLARHSTDHVRCPPLQLERVASFIVTIAVQSKNPCLQERVLKLLGQKFTERDTSPGQLLFLSVIVEAQSRIRSKSLPLPVAEVERLAVETLNVLEGLKVQSRLEAGGLMQIACGFRFLKIVAILMPDGKWFGRARMLAKEHFVQLIPTLYCGTCAVDAYDRLLDFLVVGLEEGTKREILTLCRPMWDQQWCSTSDRSSLALFLADLVIGKNQMSLPIEAWHFMFTVEEPVVAHMVMTAFVEFSRSPAAYGVDLRRLLPDSGMAFFYHNKAVPEQGDFPAVLEVYLNGDRMQGCPLNSEEEHWRACDDLKHLQQRLAEIYTSQGRECVQEGKHGMISAIVMELQDLAGRLSSNQEVSTFTEASLRQQLAHARSVIDKLEQRL
uniref:Uncharacterized protein n=1 Tax=Picocystis salinarum TaxID=88271 RepID=A0A7S3UE96_9CHLO